MIENGYKSNECDECIYSKSWNNLHVIINETKNMLKSHFDMKDLGETNFILGMKITKTCGEIFLD